jgi:hypothetical protein
MELETKRALFTGWLIWLAISSAILYSGVDNDRPALIGVAILIIVISTADYWSRYLTRNKQDKEKR